MWIAIAGGGIGGLALALFLHAAGFTNVDARCGDLDVENQAASHQ
jgi:hypothetical protein